ncbi:MAG TPA: dihydrodipicolinate synthase family protein [Solirubrobacterales bacterium]|jgi:hypothetical protein
MAITAAQQLALPTADGGVERYVPGAAPELPAPTGKPPRTRVAIAAAHVVCDPLAPGDPIAEPAIDWDATLAYRRHLWSYGLGVAEAMDTSQRGGALTWPLAQELIKRSAAEATAVGGRLVCGAATDQLDPAAPAPLEEITAAYLEQCTLIEGVGATPVVMCSRHLARTARGAEDYRRVYDEVLGEASGPVMLHWLGEVFDPALRGYWGAVDPAEAIDAVADLIAAHAERVDGIKVSLLDDELERELRDRLPDGVRVYTGDDFNYPTLIRGDERGHSDALLGIFDAIAPVAAAALGALDAGDLERYDELFAPTVPLARHIFAAPTGSYKAGVVLLAYLNGHQSHFRMLGGMESARSALHYAELFRLADRAGVLADPERAAARMRPVLELAGIEQP